MAYTRRTIIQVISIGAIWILLYIAAEHIYSVNSSYNKSPGFILTVILVLAGAAFWFWILRWHDRIEPEPLKYILGISVAGGIISVILTIIFSIPFAFLFAPFKFSISPEYPVHTWIYMLKVGLVEETAKFLAAFLLIRKSKELNEPIDALIYSMTVAMGFAVIENIQYAYNYGLGLILTRSLLCLPGHMAYAAIWGYSIAEVRFLQTHRTFFKLNTIHMRNVVVYLLLAATIHGTNNFFLSLHSTLLEILSIAIDLGLILFIHRRLIYMSSQSVFLKTGECHLCRSKNPVEAKTCWKCGAPLKKIMYKSCNKCQIRIPRNAIFCPRCGEKVVTGDLTAKELN